MTSRETANGRSPSRPRSVVHGSFPLLAKNKNALLPGETHFLHLPVFTKQHGVVVGFRVAIFPPPFAFAHYGFPLLHGAFVAPHHQPGFSAPQTHFSPFPLY